MNDPKTVNDVYTDWRGGTDVGGFFYYLSLWASSQEEPVEIPFLTSPQILDYEYHGNVSGSKITSCLVDRTFDENYFPDAALKMAETFWVINGDYLTRLWNISQQEYNPLWNYDMEEDGTDDKTGDDTTTFAGTETNTRTGQVTETGEVQGFDSTTYKPASKTTTDYTPNSTDGVKDVRSFDERSDTLTYGSTLTHHLERHGNVGVTTTQKMLEDEIKLWQWNFFYRELFPRVDKILTIPIY